ncbi:MAG: hypothetical protein JWP44_1445 [Mucilaginibacter sp.]|nr:hypothetical protein [Mucilaginibacter sp.]
MLKTLNHYKCKLILVFLINKYIAIVLLSQFNKSIYLVSPPFSEGNIND